MKVRFGAFIVKKMELSQTIIKTLSRIITCLILFGILSIPMKSAANENSRKYFINNQTSYSITNQTWATAPTGGDTIFILAERTRALRFEQMNGTKEAPIVVINSGGQVQINTEAWGAITFENCSFFKISGNGVKGIQYGFSLAAATSGLAFSELSSDCEAEFIKIDHDGFFGIFAKKDYDGNPPSPVPVFSNLSIHDCFIQNVTEGMYIGETKSPGMEFRHLKIYNNIVKNTGRESIQVANAVEDVEIYNNTLLNAGLDNISYQSNILQIGDNSVARVYNNILIGAPSYGIISNGMGNNIFTNNYIASCKGIFIDNRLFTVAGYPIQIENNYFRDITSTEAVKNMNEINFLEIRNNNWDGEIEFYKNSSGNSNNFILTNNQNVNVVEISFTNPEANDYSLAQGTPVEYVKMGAAMGGQETEQIHRVPEQIVLSSDMIVDEVTGGSYWSANYLTDEQNCTPENNLHPLSQSWKPYWNMDKGPYHIYIDLKTVHRLTNIALHDMHNTKNLVISIGEPGNWIPLFTDSCEKYKVWKQHTIDVSTRFIRISMFESIYAAVNEIVIYGYSESVEKSYSVNAELTTLSNVVRKEKNKINLSQNPINENINLIIPDELCQNFKIEIYDIKGDKLFSEFYDYAFQSQLVIDLTRRSLKGGIYLLKYSNKNGFYETLKFVRNGF